MPNDRAAVAREVLTELLEFAYARAETVSDTRQFMRERYPAPPAPETVTVDGVEWAYDAEDECWDAADSRTVYAEQPGSAFLRRIASDARVIQERDARIAELEKANADYLRELNAFNTRVTELQSERDAALRALREYQNGIGPMGSKGEGCGEVGVSTAAHGGSGATQPDQGESPVAAPSPAPIPLGAVVEVEGDSCSPYRHDTSGWRTLGHGAGGYVVQDNGWGHILTALYRARHHVATRETVERVVTILRKQAWSSVPFTHRAEEILTAAGITLEEGA